MFLKSFFFVHILEYKAKTSYTTLSIRSNLKMYFHMNFEPYRQCGIRRFCFVLQYIGY
jgi:hypothetical protein